MTPKICVDYYFTRSWPHIKWSKEVINCHLTPKNVPITLLLVKHVRINVLLMNRSVHVCVHIHDHFHSRFHVWIYKIIFENAASVISSCFFARTGFILNIWKISFLSCEHLVRKGLEKEKIRNNQRFLYRPIHTSQKRIRKISWDTHFKYIFNVHM